MSASPSSDDLDPHFLAARADVLERVGSIDAVARLGHSQSVTFRIAGGASNYLLRVHDPLNPDGDGEFDAPLAIESECTWLAALGEQTKLGVAVPVAGSDGSYVFPVALDDGRRSHASLLTWVEGAVLEGKQTPEQAATLAHVVLELHAHARAWQTPASFRRPTHDRGWTRTALARTAVLAEEGHVEQQDQSRLLEAFDMLLDELEVYERGADVSGLIHGDLHAENYLEHEGVLIPIDFGRAGYGPWLYDVAECVAYLFPDRRGYFLETLAKHSELPPNAERLIEGYLVQSVIETFGYHAPNEAGREGLLKWIASFVQKHVSYYLDGRPFLREV